MSSTRVLNSTKNEKKLFHYASYAPILCNKRSITVGSLRTRAREKPQFLRLKNLHSLDFSTQHDMRNTSQIRQISPEPTNKLQYLSVMELEDIDSYDV